MERPPALLWGKGLLAIALLIVAAMMAMSGIDLAGSTTDNKGVADPLPVKTAESRQPASTSPDKLIVPVQGVMPERLADTFTEARSDGRSHDAIDIMAPSGTRVIAAAGGRVEKLFLSEAGGNTVYVRSFDGERIYYYAHLARYASGLSDGQSVQQGQSLGDVGSTGNADPRAPHLHFAVFVGTQGKAWWDAHDAINPYDLLMHVSPDMR